MRLLRCRLVILDSNTTKNLNNEARIVKMTDTVFNLSWGISPSVLYWWGGGCVQVGGRLSTNEVLSTKHNFLHCVMIFDAF